MISTRRKTKKFRTLLTSPNLEFLMEAHNGITAKIVQKTGFKGIWASGLTMSASLGVRDNNELSWTQVVNMLEFMSDATDIPILVDGDTGYGNFNNVRRLIKYLERIEIAGVCIEDKIFPKKNSFQENSEQYLLDVNEFCGKIKAAKDAQVDSDFAFVARTEGFIAKKTLNEVLDRAYAYENAGADAIIVHSKKRDSSEIEQFMGSWQGKVPIIVIPTRYYETKTDHFRDLGIKVVIWANHLMRSLVSCCEKTANKIHVEESVSSLEPHIASLEKLFDYQNIQELEEAEKKYCDQTYVPKDESFGIIPLKQDDNQWKVFVIKHKDGGHWGFPKGHPLCAMEKACEVAERELKEETNLVVEKYITLDPFILRYTCISHKRYVNKTVMYFAAMVHGEVILCKDEIAEGVWIGLDYVCEKLDFPEARNIAEQLKKILK